MSATQRLKGKRAELEVVRILREHGWNAAKRTSDGRRQFARGDITGGPSNIHWEVKRRETIAIGPWLKQAADEAEPGCWSLVVFRRSHEEWQIAGSLDGLLVVLDELEELREAVEHLRQTVRAHEKGEP